MFKQRFYGCVVALVLVFASFPVVGQDRRWTQTGELMPGWEFVDDAVRQMMQARDVPGLVIAISKEGRLIFAHGYTWDSPEVEPIEPTSLFRIASMSKPITSVAIHQLIERGLLSYDTRIVDVLDLEPPPGFEPDPWLDQVTIDHLLCHTGGWDRALAFDPMFYDQNIALAVGVDRPISKYDVATYMSGKRMQFSPGSRFAYSNYGYALLGMAIEEITGRDYSEWVAENIFQPIAVGRPRRGHTAADERAPGEVRYNGRPGENPYYWNIENMDAHGGWILSAPDYLRFMSALCEDPDNSPLLERDSIEAMVEVNPVSGDWSYARGWGAVEFDGQMIYTHGGSLPGTATNAEWSSDGFGVVVLANTSRELGDIDADIPQDLPGHDLFESVGIVPSVLGVALAESWIPMVTSGSGAGGSVWSSDIGLLNRSMLSNQIRLRIEMEDVVVDREFVLAPGEYCTRADVVSDLGLQGSGSLRVFSSEPLTVTSRIYNSGPDGTFGQFLSGATGPGGLANGDSAVLMHLRQDDFARSNIGILNAGRREARVQIDLYEDSGTEIASFSRRVGPRQVRQLNRPFVHHAGRNDVPVGYAMVKVLDGEEVVVYGSVVDAGTNDPTTIPMKIGSGATTVFVAAAARADGLAGSIWRTDLGLLNIGVEAVDVRVAFHRSNVADLTMDLILDPGEHRVLEDVIGLLGGEGTGFLEILADEPILVSSRTFNQGDRGTFGQYLDGLSEADTIAATGRVWLPQLQQNTDFRTNIGLLNTGSDQARVNLRLFDASGVILATTQRLIDAGERVQFLEPFDRFAGRADVDDGYAVLEIMAGSGVAAYASVIDNRTNDPTTIAMVR